MQGIPDNRRYYLTIDADGGPDDHAGRRGPCPGGVTARPECGH